MFARIGLQCRGTFLADYAKCHRIIEDLGNIQELMYRASPSNTLGRYTRSVVFHKAINL